ncbi:IS3 family transposase [Clostridium sporogenes]|uniref:IS3 family transposase n=1 Tax=Clostridium sporogenes TaxID=1509 RepID=A0AAE4FGK5_CLOSG|nr:IS3 family transposase [Clostridium sporogenes]MDS1001901.1 IS3 family transposase [Clostridium sporogenes]
MIRKKVYKRKFKSSNIMDNLLDRNFTANMPLQRICMDITYIPINKKAKKFLYLNAAKDLFNGEIVAYDVSTRSNISLVQKTVDKLLSIDLPKECIIHTDQGFQYTHKKYCNQLKNSWIIQSMSRKGNCWDNAPIESFFSNLKSELIYLIDEYIYFYNNERIQLKFGMSPVEYRTHAS